ncbi:MAG TPA: transglutaminase-like domain-containing protein, partial [Polyangiaceae bacterium]|nr:transglutaminase-like domain-containing protein [Polyangiaceae bacterium]
MQDWGGVRIVVPPVVQVRRLLPGRGAKGTPVKMDLRIFVPSNASNVIDSWINDEVSQRRAREPWLAALLATRATPGWFDAIAHLVADIVFERIDYELRGGGAWQLAEETLALGRGDCEDRATLLGSALVASGISPYNVRVALGNVKLSEPGKRSRRVAHAWVVYRGEDGAWTPLEPVPSAKSRRKHPQVGLTYEPDYVFNGDHQWRMNLDDEPKDHERWNKLDPSFHGEVHKSIVEHAAADAKLPEALRTRISRMFTGLLGHVIDKPDLNVRAYDPRDHFDNGLIDASWAAVQRRLGLFNGSPLGDPTGLVNACFACHGIADFYAHSSYAHFLDRERPGQITPFDPVTKKPALGFDYAADPTFARAELSCYAPWYSPDDFPRFARWKGK